MRRAAEDDGAVLVQLDEADDAPLAEPADHAAAPRRRPLWWIGVVVVVVVVVAVGVANVVAARRTAQWRAAMADTPWVLPEMSGPLLATWRLEGGGSVVGETPTAILVSGSEYLGIRAVEPSSGRLLWEIPRDEGYCAVVPDGLAVALAQVPPEDAAQFVLCSPADAAASAAVVTSFDAHTGEELARIGGLGSPIGTMLVDSDLLAVSELPDGGVGAVLTDLRTGEARWTFRGTPDVRQQVFSDFWNFTYDDEVLFFDGPDDLVLSRATGEPVSTDRRPPVFEGWQLPDGGRVVITGTGMGGDVGNLGGQVVEPDGSVRFEFAGWPWPPTQYSSADVLVVQQTLDEYPATQLAGIDLAGGAELWSRRDDTGESPLTAIDGVMVLRSSDVATGIDLRTGEEMWTHPVDSVAWWAQAPTDGRVVLVPLSTDGVLELVAVDLHTGEDRWRMPALGGVSQVFTSKGLVIMDTDDELVAYRP